MPERTVMTCVVLYLLKPSIQPGNWGLGWELQSIIGFLSITLSSISVNNKPG